MLLSIFPGAGHYYLDRYLMAALLFGAFVTSANGLFLGSTLQSSAHHPEVMKGVSMGCLVVVWLMSIVLTYKQSYGTDRKSLAQNRGILLRAALVDYVRDDLEDSAKKLEQAVELDVDWQDPDPLFHLGVVMLRIAERSAARALKESARAARRRSQWAFRTCLGRDRDKKWRTEIARESKRMRRILSITGRLKKVDSSTSSARLSALSETGSFPELQASGAYRRALVSSSAGDSSPSNEIPPGVLSELGAELEAPGGSDSPLGGVRNPPKPSSSPYLPPPTRSYSRPNPALLAEAETALILAKDLSLTPEPRPLGSDTEPSDTEPSDTEPGDTEPSDTEPSDSEPSDTEPSDTEPSDTEPGDTEPGDTEPGDTEPGDIEPGDTEPGDTEPGDTEPGDTEPSDTEPGSPDCDSASEPEVSSDGERESTGEKATEPV